MSIDIHFDSLKELHTFIDRVAVLGGDTKPAEEKTEKKSERAKVSRERVLQLHKEDLSAAQIAAQLGCSTVTVYNILKQEKK